MGHRLRAAPGPLRLLALLALFFTSNAMSTENQATEPAQQLDAIVAGEIEGSPPLAGLQVLVLRGGEVAFEYAGGFARLTADGAVPLGLEHKPRIASISKLVAAVGLVRLVEQGRVDLDADVSAYLGFTLRNPSYPDVPITLRQILSHTSSIRDGGQYWLEEGGRFEDFFLPGSEVYDDGAHFATGEGRQPGVFFEYANLNFGVVAGVIERVSGQRFDRYMRQAVLEPLGLQSSYNVCDLSWKQPEKIATLYRKRDADEVWRPQDDWVAQLDDAKFSCYYGRPPVARGEDPGEILPGYHPGSNPTLFSPQGGLRASARDLAQIGRLLLNGGALGGQRLVAEQTVDEMFSPQWVYDPAAPNGNTSEGIEPGDPGYRPLFTAYGLSVQRIDLADWGLSEQPRRLFGHLGDAYGLLGQFWIDPENGDALIALITGLGDDPSAQPGSTPLERPEDEIMRWWVANFPR